MTTVENNNKKDLAENDMLISSEAEEIQSWKDAGCGRLGV